mmetsp:Transcript_14650/g.19118  ORF Transcript_14650/g.19118 Transcript_14650/m.19118 type:complete len:622 (+) Transcript_14650:485-2350(+)
MMHTIHRSLGVARASNRLMLHGNANKPTIFQSLSTRNMSILGGKEEEEEFFVDGEWAGCSKQFRAPITIAVRGTDILTDPLFNKGTAFKTGERDRLRFRGLLPPRISTIMQQKGKILASLREETSNIKKNIMLEDVHDRNETLYHRILVDHIEEVAPLIYTPTVGQACKEFGDRFRRPRGMYFTKEDRGHMASMVYNWPHNDVRIICVTDGSRILGLGDLGANGMGIPIGKLSLYCAAGGIAPHRVLPVMLDMGTDNEELLESETYMGTRERRLHGEEFYELADEFMQAVRHRWPNVLVQFEDFSSDKAQILLNKYREHHLCFNDDIQGTGATTLAGILGALRAKGEEVSSLGKQRILIAGAGSAGIGVAQVMLQAMIEQGYSEKEAKAAFFVVDQNGLIGKKRIHSLSPEQAIFARKADDDGISMLEVVKKYKPTIILGVTAVGGLFTEELISEMASHVDKPIIFPLSNPTVKAECTAEQAFEWTNGNCIFASGSPLDPVEMNGKIYYTSQCNNMYVFPGLGLGASICGAKKVTDRMLYVAAEALANYVSSDDHSKGKVFPSLGEIRQVSHTIAIAVIKEALKENLATKDVPLKDIQNFVAKRMYDPVYVPLVEKREVTI